MFEKIRIRIGQYYLKKELERLRRTVQLTSLNGARKIGILYSLDDVPDYERVSEFVSVLQNEQKEVKALGYVKNKELVQRFLPKLSYDFFSRRDLTWFYKPVHATVKDFIEKEFDLLIDLSTTDNFPLRYISGLSRSLYKVGCFSAENTLYYDFMINLRPGMSTSDYLGHIQHYLSIIKPNE
jgi:hypothetical protein